MVILQNVFSFPSSLCSLLKRMCKSKHTNTHRARCFRKNLEVLFRPIPCHYMVTEVIITCQKEVMLPLGCHSRGIVKIVCGWCSAPRYFSRCVWCFSKGILIENFNCSVGVSLKQRTALLQEFQFCWRENNI